MTFHLCLIKICEISAVHFDHYYYLTSFTPGKYFVNHDTGKSVVTVCFLQFVKHEQSTNKRNKNQNQHVLLC